MDAQRKSIQGLTVSLDEKREELSTLYRQFGAKLLNDTADNSAGASALDAERIDAWKSFMTGRESDTQTVLDIKAALARLTELNQFRKELEHTRDEASRSCDQRLKALGEAFRDMNPEDAEELFGPSWKAAWDASTALTGLEVRQKALRDELESSGFFGKMKTQFKLASLESDIRQRREKLDRQLLEGGRTLMAREDFAGRAAGGGFGPEFSRVYQAAREAKDRLDDLAGRAQTLDSDIQLVKSGLEDAEALENPQRRMDELRTRIRETDRRIDSHASLVAREYVDKFYDDEGATRIGPQGESADTGGMGAYARQLEKSAALRSEIAGIRTKIEILETAIKIESLDRNISQWEHTVRDYEQRIKKYQELIGNAKRDAAEAGREREKLVSLREELERASSGRQS